ncbi:hypothetical protein LPB140_00240 [Sphingorhabdus lutea]|uniref:Uncharacterized protein n=1 Tax=Sphingorhabdus lutea TaxID=1913578 RepID=A0A1L3J8U9_9SPHN|nr:hypothetical protein [Sphingorhabdus lutea]APG61530.1 hypothetical protein LPB140_00240 [Sphingorhabdus lutea]
MKNISLKKIKITLYKQRPPTDIKILQELININWSKISGANIDDACEIILRVSADVIIIRSCNTDPNYFQYKTVFSAIEKNIRASGLLDLSVEFNSYFRKFNDHLNKMKK